MTRDEMMQWLKDEITLSGAININLPDKEYHRTIDNELKTIYQLDERALEKKFCVLPWQIFYTPEFRANRLIQFPDCVFTVSKFEEMGKKQNLLGTYDPAFGIESMFMANIMSGGGTGVSLDAAAMWTLNWSVYDQMRNFILSDIRHQWNESSHQLLVLGHDPKNNVWCEVYTKVHESLIFDDIYCQRYIAARAKLKVARLLGTFTTQLIGGVTINTNIYTDEAQKDIDDCKEYWKNLRENSWFFETTP